MPINKFLQQFALINATRQIFIEENLCLDIGNFASLWIRNFKKTKSV